MRTSLSRLPVAAVLALAALAGPALGQAQPILANELVDDALVPSPADLKARASAVRVLPGPAAAGGERVSYTSFFTGQKYVLTRFHGRYVDVLLPDTWTEPGALSEAQIRAYVDRNDLIYQQLLDLTGAPPSGNGPLPIAVISRTCGLGCGYVGAKGIEMEDEPEFRSSFWQEIAEDMPSGVIIHEMTHNFDLFSRYVSYPFDSSHAWTNFISYYYSAYTHEGGVNTTPDEVTRYWLTTTAPYFQDPGAEWELCVRDGHCLDRYIRSELAWGGFSFRLGLLEGPQSVRGFLAFLLAYRQSNQPPATPEGKDDLYLEAWAAGTGHNLSCVADAWRWHLSDSLRERMGQLYGASNPLCQDLDRDGFSPLLGDCDDRRAAVRPGAPERIPRVDDDCDGRVDETVLREPEGRDFAASQRLILSTEISGVTPGSDMDTFMFGLKAPRRVWLEGCSADFGSLSLVRGTRREGLPMYGSGCYQGAFPLSAGIWTLEVGISPANGSRYQVALENAAPWPVAPWARTAPPRRRGGSFVLTAATTLRNPPGPGAQVRFWVSGQGVVATVPYSRVASFIWEPPPGVDPAAEGLTYRAQLLVGGIPAAEITRPQPF